MTLHSLCAALLCAAPLSAQITPVAPKTAAGPRLIAGLVQADLAGQTLAQFPHFSHTQTFFEGSIVEVGLDPTLHPDVVGRTADLFVCAHRTLEQWSESPTLVDVRGASQVVTISGGTIQANTFLIDAGFLSGDAGATLGVGYDVVLDFDRDGLLSSGDVVDGASDRPGMWMLVPTTQSGPYAVTEVLYSGGTWLGQNLFYPSNIASLGQRPLVVVSHGNGHNYQWYDHIGTHLASWGYIVMSHQNNTAPGTETASTTTLTNTDYLLGNLATIAGGVLVGHVDTHQIAWFGHSRGGEGVARAYDRIFDGAYTPVNYTIADLKLVSSIAPTDFQGTANTNPHGVTYSLWTGGADADVNGCADCPICQTFHLLERATDAKYSISLHGVGHGAFHNNTGSGTVSAGPCLLSRSDTHAIMRSYILPLVALTLQGNHAGEEVLWRQWESFRSPGVPTNSCVVVDLMHRPVAARRVAIDDFQSQPATSTSSSGGLVTFDVTNLVEGRFDDANTTFVDNSGDVMNGMTFSGGASDTSSGLVFDWNGADRSLAFEVVPALRDLTQWSFLSFRACQATRHPNTTAVLGDLVFSVRVRDGAGLSSTISIGAYGGGIEEPYQRTACGSPGAGWANEFETVRLRVEDFARNGSGVNLADVVAVEFLFGPSYGATRGRLGFDDVELIRE